ncbi:hypothetical protein AVEN_85043-1 [Araneus ventricosus]|uniref:Uncharacterized protein n=1 Tax=Araneus ventricosus TaxID=182803 RepID=A0A4Y2MVE6_ARAVE|nr:hypothetical protein AVEN_85043-1 [Araneus ventricosus]
MPSVSFYLLEFQMRKIRKYQDPSWSKINRVKNVNRYHFPPKAGNQVSVSQKAAFMGTLERKTHLSVKKNGPFLGIRGHRRFPVLGLFQKESRREMPVLGNGFCE